MRAYQAFEIPSRLPGEHDLGHPRLELVEIDQVALANLLLSEREALEGAGMLSRRAVTAPASGSASSSAEERIERASVPGETWARSAIRESFDACSRSKLTLIRLLSAGLINTDCNDSC